MEAGVGRHLPGGEADVAHSHGERLAAAPRGAEQGLLGHLAEGSDDRHAGTCGSHSQRFSFINESLCQNVFFISK